MVSFPWKKVRNFGTVLYDGIVIFHISLTKQTVFLFFSCCLVLRDLQVLEEQQRESQRKLQHARDKKQRTELQRAALEQQLGNLKFEDGKIKAEIAQTHKLLSKGQRSIAAVRGDAKKAEQELRDFDS